MSEKSNYYRVERELTHQEVIELYQKTKKERDELKAWKEEATEVMNKLQLQEIAKELELPLGSDISSQILPNIKQLLKEDYAKEVTKCYSQLKDEFDQWKSIAEELAERLKLRKLFAPLLAAEEAVLDEFEKLKKDNK